MSSLPTDVQMPSEVNDSVRAVLSLFRGPLKGVAFPDTDGAKLEGLLAEVRARNAQVAMARLSLEGAQHELDAALTELTQSARRAHAYAVVYAQEDPELSLELEGINIQPRAERRRRKVEAPVKKKRRSAKAGGPELPLPHEADSTEADLH